VPSSGDQILSDAAAEVVAVGAGNVVAVGAGNILSNGSSGLKTPPNLVAVVKKESVVGVGAGGYSNMPAPENFTRHIQALPVTSKGCTDPWLSKAIDAVSPTGTPPDGGVEGICSPDLIGLAQGQYFLNEADYTKNVRQYFKSRCVPGSEPAPAIVNGDVWLTRAITEVTNRQPNGPECDIKRYNNAHWNTYEELRGLVSRAGLFTRPRKG
jgi:hypothetical protein